jgi:hypothetical protein
MAPVHMTTAPAVPFHSSNWSKDGKKQGHHNKNPFFFSFSPQLQCNLGDARMI